MTIKPVAFTCAILFALGISGADARTYCVDLGTPNDFIKGTIATDGKIGQLTPADVTNWNITITEKLVGRPGYAKGRLRGPKSGNNSYVQGEGLRASKTALSFPFNQSLPSVLAFTFATGIPNNSMVQFQSGTASNLAFGTGITIIASNYSFYTISEPSDPTPLVVATTC
jgi:hypothetical protein